MIRGVPVKSSVDDSQTGNSKRASSNEGRVLKIIIYDYQKIHHFRLPTWI